MNVNQKVIPIKTGTVRTISGMVQTIANNIKQGEYPKEKMDITQFFNKIGKGNNYAPKSETRIQVRPRDRNTRRIERAVNKMLASGDTSGMKPLTVIYYPDTNTYKLLNGNHTSEMAINMGIDTMDVHIVNFETQLEGKLSNAILLGDLLNTVDIEQEATENDKFVALELLQYLNH